MNHIDTNRDGNGLEAMHAFALALVCEALMPAPTPAERAVAMPAHWLKQCSWCGYAKHECACSPGDREPDVEWDDDPRTRETVELSGEEADELIATADPRTADTQRIEVRK